MGEYGDVERTDLQHFLLWESVVVLKELISQFLALECVVALKEVIFDSFYFGRVWWSSKNPFLTVSKFRMCGGAERTDFNSFYFERVWWS